MTEENKNSETKKVSFGYTDIPEEEKVGKVKGVFDSVSSKYDVMNDFMSMGTHRLWKKIMAEKTHLSEGQIALDVAGGTGDIALLMREQVKESGHVYVYDINYSMLEYGRDKCFDKGAVSGLTFLQGDGEKICFADNTFHCVTVAFGIRNFTNIQEGLNDMYRVLKPGGRLICLEFSHPKSKLFKKIYDAYSFGYIPAVGKAITGDRDSYQYLAESIRKFPKQEKFKQMMLDAGFFKARYHNLFNGICAIHIGTKV